MATATPSVDPRELAREYARCQALPAHFLDHHARISDPQQGIVPFRLWPFQRELLDVLEGQQRIIVLKARQLGVSWLLAGYALWTAAYRDGANVLMLSKRQDEAVSLLDKAEHIYTHLPAWLQPSVGKRNETTLQFARRGSKITALPSTGDAGRSESASLVIVDEAAFHPHAADNYGAYKPTVDAGGKLVIVSTANGRGNWYHQMWAGAPANGFVAVFLPWTLRPGRDAGWWAQQEREYAATPHLLAQEYPANAAQAFIASGNCLFDVALIQQYLEGCRPPIETHDNGQLRIWQRPVPGRAYVAGADVAEGIDAGNDRLDYSGVAVLDWQTGTHVADWHGQCDTHAFAQVCRDLCVRYNHALLGVERNNHGHAVLEALRNHPELRYDRLYWHTELTAALGRRPEGTRKLPGWPTTPKTKPVLEGEFAQAIASQSICSWDAALWDECLSYVRRGDGTSGAQEGTHDDRVLKIMIAWQMRKHYVAPAGRGVLAGQFRTGG